MGAPTITFGSVEKLVFTQDESPYNKSYWSRVMSNTILTLDNDCLTLTWYAAHSYFLDSLRPLGTPWAEYEITFYVMDCGGPRCTVIDFDGNVHVTRILLRFCTEDEIIDAC